MLIVTSRHTKADLKLYQDYEEIDKINRVRPEKINRSLQIIESWIDNHPDTAAYTSWGKDSVVLLHLLSFIERKIPVIYVRVRETDNPDCELVRDIFLKNHNMNYYEEIFDHNEIFMKGKKTSLQRNRLHNKYGYYRITGIRNDESGLRKMIFLMYRECSIYSCRPLSLWKNHEIFAYIQQNKLPLSPVYGYLGGGRWKREHLRTHSLADTTADSFGRVEWEREYYPDIIAKIVKHTQ